MVEAGYCLVYVTAPDVDTARKIGESVVSGRLAACANILPGMQSIYWWQGAMETANECVLLLKTRRSLASALTDAVKALHPYDCPCVVTLPIDGGNPAFLAWIDAETTGLGSTS